MNKGYEELITILAKMEKEIIEERQASGNEGKSSFSYRLYASRVRGYDDRDKAKNTKEQVRKRIEDIIVQYQINLEDNPLDEVQCRYFHKKIKEAKMLLNLLEKESRM